MSRPPRFFISPDQVSEGTITIIGDDVKHIGAVLRMKTGDELLLCDGRGTDYRAAIIRMERTEILAEIRDASKRSPASPRIILCQGLPKSDKMDLIVQKATELGAAAIVPLVTERTIVKIRDEEKRIGRWQKIAREAAMQSNRPDIPAIEPVLRFGDFLRTLAPGPGTLLLLPWEEGTEPIKTILRGHSDARQVIVLIGPEGGFSQTEAGLARDRGFHTVSLGPTILRTETAALAALGMVLYEFS